MEEMFMTPKECFLDAVRMYIRRSPSLYGEIIPVEVDEDTLEIKGAEMSVCGSDDTNTYRFFCDGNELKVEKVSRAAKSGYIDKNDDEYNKNFHS